MTADWQLYYLIHFETWKKWLCHFYTKFRSRCSITYNFFKAISVYSHIYFFYFSMKAPEWVNCVENNVPSWLSALLFKSTLKNELREICRNHGKSESSFFCLDCHTAICLQCLREAHQEHKNIRVQNFSVFKVFFQTINSPFSYVYRCTR